MRVLPEGYPEDQIEAITLLTSKTELTLDDLKVMVLLENAGEHFYLAAADAVDNEQASALLARNGQEERGHAHRLLKAIELLGGEPYPMPDNAENPYIQPMDLTGMINADLMVVIEQSEKDGDLSYQGWADTVGNEEVAKIFRQNGAEESRHGERVAEVAALLAG